MSFSSVARTVLILVGTLMVMPTVYKELCLLCLILGGRLLIVRYTGHGLSGDDLNMGTPSVDRESLKCSGQVKKKNALFVLEI